MKTKTTKKTDPKMTQTAIVDAGKSLAAAFYERDTEIRLLLVAALARENVCLLGRAGVAKSALVRGFASLLGGAKVFETLLTKFSVPEQVVGALKLSALENDRYERNTENTVLDCDLAFIDEIFKSNSAVLNTLLPIMNEGIFHNGGATAMKLPIKCLIGASNEMPEDEGLGALWDRFLLRCEVEPLQLDANRAALLKRAATGASVPAVAAALTLDQWSDACDAVGSVAVPDAVIELVCALRRELERDGITFGDRRWVKCVRLLQASAYLSGADAVDEEHVDILEHALWSTREDRAKISAIVAKIASPHVAEASELADAALLQAAELMKASEKDGVDADAVYRAMTVLRTAGVKIGKSAEQLREGSRQREKLEAMRATLRDAFARAKSIIEKLHAIEGDA